MDQCISFCQPFFDAEIQVETKRNDTKHCYLIKDNLFFNESLYIMPEQYYARTIVANKIIFMCSFQNCTSYHFLTVTGLNVMECSSVRVTDFLNQNSSTSVILCIDIWHICSKRFQVIFITTIIRTITITTNKKR